MFVRRRRAEYNWIPVSPRDPLPTLGAVPLAVDLPAPALTAAGAKGAGLRSSLSFAEAIVSLGVPASNLPPEEELVDLLQNAAEIEHGLMIQYLYSMYSINHLVTKGILSEIAIEEMGHFITVQNLLISCGQPPY